MIIKSYKAIESTTIENLFVDAFTDSEGPEEGKIIGELVANMIRKTPSNDLIGFVMIEDGLVGAVFFSRFVLPVNKKAYILSPMAIATSLQRQGLGQQLINHGIDALEEESVEILLTYGDPHYYGRFGFETISEQIIESPQPLSFPHGWLAQSLSNEPLVEMPGETRCISALDNAVYW